MHLKCGDLTYYLLWLMYVARDMINSLRQAYDIHLHYRSILTWHMCTLQLQIFHWFLWDTYSQAPHVTFYFTRKHTKVMQLFSDLLVSNLENASFIMSINTRASRHCLTQLLFMYVLIVHVSIVQCTSTKFY